MDAGLRSLVRQRAGNCCEYCGIRQEHVPFPLFHIEHIIPRVHGGGDTLENLALACIDCNLHEGTNLAGIDPQTQVVTELFHPRRQRWDDHFVWRGIHLAGKTGVGRATNRVLHMNSEDQLSLRSS